MEKEMSGTERRVSATEARVRFGELLDSVTARHDVVFVERAGKEVAVVVSVEEWEAACAGRANKWARANAMLAEYHERLRAEGAIERLKDFDVEGAIRAGRDDRDEQLYGRVH
jgi:prevent-host-death family protein